MRNFLRPSSGSAVSLPTVPCWPDVWEHTQRVLAFWGGAAAYVALLVFLLWAPVIHRRSLRNTSRLLGVLGLISGGLIVFALLMTGGLPGQGVPEERRIIQSADGQVATLIYQAGFLGRDITEVTLKRNGCCQNVTVFSHFGTSGVDDPKVEWLDNRHLRIAYHARLSDGADKCETHLVDITIVCQAEIWDWDKPKD